MITKINEISFSHYTSTDEKKKFLLDFLIFSKRQQPIKNVREHNATLFGQKMG